MVRGLEICVLELKPSTWHFFFLAIALISEWLLILTLFRPGARGGETPPPPPSDLFPNNFFIVARIDMKFSVNSQLSFSDHMKFFRDRSGS